MSIELKCTTCAAPLVQLGEDVEETPVVYAIAPCGQQHNDNCLSRVAYCANEHQTKLSVRRACEGCDWRGRPTCFCHVGEKLDTWPNLPVRSKEAP